MRKNGQILQFHLTLRHVQDVINISIFPFRILKCATVLDM